MSLIPKMQAITETYGEIGFPVGNIILDRAAELECKGILEQKYRPDRSRSYNETYDLLKAKAEIRFETLCPDTYLSARRMGGISWYFEYTKGDKIYPCALGIDNREAKIMVGFHDRKEGMEIINDILAIVPVKEIQQGATIVKVNFWVRGTQGPKKFERDLDVIPFKDLKDNYDPATKELLADLVNYKPTKGGQVFVITGIPGTGKTHAIRSLLWEWHEWADFHYVVDANTFFGEDPSYMMKVIFNELSDEEEAFPDSANVSEIPMKWKLVIMEDAGDLIKLGAKQELRQGMSQFLNLTDGMLGQGLKLIFLITTNEELGKLDPALTRPGRCAVRHEFLTLSQDESNTWLEAHKYEGEKVTRPQTIAELYAKLDGSDKKLGFNPPPVERKAGFV